MKLLLFSVLICIQLSLIYAKAKVICYYPNWRLDTSFYQTLPEDIDPTLCTHIQYAFQGVDATKNVVSEGTPQTDLYNRIEALKKKNPDVKVIVSIGGGGAKDSVYSSLVADANKRKQFINNTIAYLLKYKFDGLDIDWEYPVCWGGDCSKGPKSDKANFGIFTKELRTEFDKQSPKLSLSAAVVGGGSVADNSYDFAAIGAALDYVSVMTYDAAGSWETVTDHHSRFEMCTSVMKYFSDKGIPKEKVLMGVPFYGHTFKLKDKNQHGLGAPNAGMGKTPNGEDDYTSYHEICDLVKNKGWSKGINAQGHDPYAYHDLLWVGYDDPNQAYLKSKWVKDNGYGGAMVWELSYDDVKAKCCKVTFPLLRSVNLGLYGTGDNITTYGCE